jgi:hypothetical protein
VNAGDVTKPGARPLAVTFTDAALTALDARIEELVERRLRDLLPAALKRVGSTPWLDTNAAAAYLTITENALRLRVRAGLVVAHHDPAGRLRFHRDDLDHAMTPVYPRGAKR